jgi:ATP-dependent DNA helicase RecG
MVLVPQQFERWLLGKLPNVARRESSRRVSSPDIPFEMIREAVVNALVHRDYDVRGAKSQVIVTPDTIVVKSPGAPIAPITIGQMKDFSAPMLSRNPALHYVFAQMELAEERGLGLRSLKSGAEQQNHPRPTFSWEPPYLILTLYRNRTAVVPTFSGKPGEGLLKAELKGWLWLAVRGKTTSREYAKAIDVDDRTARRHLNHFVRLGLIAKVGSGPSTEYVR